MKASGEADIRDEKGNRYQGPPADGLSPPASKGTLAAHLLSPKLDPNWNTDKAGNQDGACPNPNNPRREGGALPEPALQRFKTEGAKEKEKDDEAFSEKRSVGLPYADIVVAIRWHHIAKAGNDPNRGWPPRSIPFPTAKPSLRQGTIASCHRNVGGSVGPPLGL